jgi:hypothetical protein
MPVERKPLRPPVERILPAAGTPAERTQPAIAVELGADTAATAQINLERLPPRWVDPDRNGSDPNGDGSRA